jgi:hypothetical protein
MALPLTSFTDHNGFYLIGNVTGAGESRVMFTRLESKRNGVKRGGTICTTF